MTDEATAASLERFIEQGYYPTLAEVEEEEARQLVNAWLIKAQEEGLKKHQIDSLGDLVKFAMDRMGSMRRAEERRQAARD